MIWVMEAMSIGSVPPIDSADEIYRQCTWGFEPRTFLPWEKGSDHKATWMILVSILRTFEG